jgi:hypothetical protein
MKPSLYEPHFHLLSLNNFSTSALHDTLKDNEGLHDLLFLLYSIDTISSSDGLLVKYWNGWRFNPSGAFSHWPYGELNLQGYSSGLPEHRDAAVNFQSMVNSLSGLVHPTLFSGSNLIKSILAYYQDLFCTSEPLTKVAVDSLRAICDLFDIINTFSANPPDKLFAQSYFKTAVHGNSTELSLAMAFSILLSYAQTFRFGNFLVYRDNYQNNWKVAKVVPGYRSSDQLEWLGSNGYGSYSNAESHETFYSACKLLSAQSR